MMIGITFKKGLALQCAFRDKIDVGLGIGTYFTNYVTDEIQPLSIVIKIIECDDQPVAKLSDSEDKQMCENKNYTEVLKELFKQY